MQFLAQRMGRPVGEEKESAVVNVHKSFAKVPLRLIVYQPTGWARPGRPLGGLKQF